MGEAFLGGTHPGLGGARLTVPGDRADGAGVLGGLDVEVDPVRHGQRRLHPTDQRLQRDLIRGRAGTEMRNVGQSFTVWSKHQTEKKNGART